MSFFGFIGILLILGIMLGGLYLSKSAQTKAEELQSRKRRLRELRLDLNDLDEITRTLLLYDRHVSLLELFTDQMQQLIENGLQILPSNADLLSDQSELDAMIVKINQLKEAPAKPEIPTSDRQIFVIKKQFHQAIKILKKLQSQGAINEDEVSGHQTRLMTSSLLIEVDAYCTQGHEAKAAEELNVAASFFKHAKELLVASEISFPDKSEKIEQISNEIKGVYETLPDEEPKEEKQKK